jgi:hypothetical protein
MRWLVVVAVLLGARVAHADELPFATSFDPGNRLVLEAGWGGAGGAGGALAVRHKVGTDDPAVTWRFEHVFAGTRWDGVAWRGALYRGVYLRHSRDGHIVLPTSPPKKLWLPFDVGTDVAAGVFAWRPGEDVVELGVVRAAVLFELFRSSGFGARLTLGPLARWDVAADVADREADEHRVAPFSQATLGLHLETDDGLGVLDASVEGGWRWSSVDGWGREAGARLDVERVLVAVNDVPVALYGAGGWESGERGAWWQLGVRVGFGAAR